MRASRNAQRLSVVLAVGLLGCVQKDTGPLFPADAGDGFDVTVPSGDTGSPASVTIPTSIDFGLAECGGASPNDQTFVIANTGGNTLTLSLAFKTGAAFTISAGSAKIPPSLTTSITVHANPVPSSATAALPITDTLFVTTNDPAHASLSIPVTVTPRGATLTITPSSAAFGAVPLGVAATPIAVAVANVGNEAVTVAFGAPTDAQFSLPSQAPVTLAAAGSASVSIGFTPAAVAPATASVALTTSGGAVCGASVTSIPLSGESTAPAASVPTTLIDFGLSACGGAAPGTKTLTVTNIGGAPLHVTSAAFGTAAFAVTGATFPITIGAGSKSDLTLSASAVPASAAAGAAITDTLTIGTDDASHAKITVPVSVTPQGAFFTLSPATAAFPVTPILSTATPIPLALTNTGNMGVTVSFGAPSDGQFSLAYTGSPAAVAVAAGAQVPALAAGFAPNTLSPSAATAAIQVTGTLCGTTSASAIGFSGQGTGEDGGPFTSDGGLAGDGCVPLVCSLIGPGACGEVQTCGTVIECGACEAGAVCNPTTHICGSVPSTCAALSAQCGFVTDECGVQVSCGSCPSSQICQASTHQCVPCTPHTSADCASQGLCGVIETGCVPSTATIDCGVCPGQQACNPTTHTCACSPLTACPKAACGVIQDGCGGTLDCGPCGGPECSGKCGTISNACGSATEFCGGCPTGQFCIGSVCVACTPKTSCANGDCGVIPNGCGGSLECPGCEIGTCIAGTCSCTPKTQCDPNDCGKAVTNGCGGTLDCSSNTCAGGTCVNNLCCTPKTCGPNDCGPGIPDGCGATIDCSANTCGDAGALCFQSQCCTPSPSSCSPQMCGTWFVSCGVQLDCGNTCNSDTQVCLGTCCTRKTSCQPTDCGPTASDGCNGTIDCSGQACPGGQVCSSSGSCCVPTKTQCGPNDCGSAIPDGCGNTLNCSDNGCGGGTCVNDTCCTPAKCGPNDCGGEMPNGCGGTINCSKNPCQGGVCSGTTCCTPLACSSVSSPSCQPIADNCGGTITCFACPTGSTCEPDGSCCTPTGCNGRTGNVPDGCGGTLSCP